MNKNVKIFIGDSFVYGISSALNKVIGIILFPLLITQLGENEFGLYDYYLVSTSFAVIAITFGFDSGLARFYYNEDSLKYRNGLITNVLILNTSFYILQFILFLFFRKDTLFGQDGKLDFYFFQINLFFQLGIGFALNLLRWSQRKTGFVIVSVGTLLFQLIIFYLVSHYHGLDLINAIAILLSVNGVFFVISLFFVFRVFSFDLVFKDLLELILYSLPLGVIGVLASFSPTYERSLVINFFNESVLTKYSIISKMGILITIAINAFHSAWGPFILSRDIYSKEIQEIANKLLVNYVRFGLVFVLFVSLVTPSLIRFFTEIALEEYFELVLLISFVFLMRGLGWLFDTAQILNKSSKYSLIGSLIQSTIVFLSLSWSAREFSLHGVVHVLVVAQLVRLLYDWYISRRWQRVFTLDMEALGLILWGGGAFYFSIVWVNSCTWVESHFYAFLAFLAGCFFLNKNIAKWKFK